MKLNINNKKLPVTILLFSVFALSIFSLTDRVLNPSYIHNVFWIVFDLTALVYSIYTFAKTNPISK